MLSGRPLSRSCRRSPPSPEAGGRGSMTGLPWPASSLSCALAYHGRCCLLRSAARHDVLAPAAGLAGCRCVDAPASHPARALGRCRETRLEPGRARLFVHRGEKGGAATGPNPTDRGNPGTKRHVVVDRAGTPLGLSLSGAHRHDSLMLAPTLDAVPPVRHGRGRPRCRPHKLHADKAYDHQRCCAECWRRSIAPRIARRGVDDSERLGRHRWVSSAPWHGSTASAVSPFAMSAARTSIWHSPRSDVLSSASTNANGFVRRS
jgi:hypothetical protein